MLRASILAASILLAPLPAHSEVLEGVATAIDGDTIDMTGTRVRLIGIDAPEATQTCLRDGVEWNCGSEASASLGSMLSERPIVCVSVATDIYGRKVARCRTRVIDLAQEQLRRGMAIIVSGAPPEYEQASAIAKRLRSGIWSSRFQEPRDWRAENNAQEPVAEYETARSPRHNGPAVEPEYRNEFGCAIKGNRNRRGEWIYHLPGRPYYDRTRAEELFCTESAARAAGYRRSRAD